MKAPLPADEGNRLASLRCYEVLDTPPEQSFDDLTMLAAQICQAPIALVSLVDESRQWFKSRIGINVVETPRDGAFCAHVILTTDEVLEVPDALMDDRFCDSPLVTSAPYIRFYAGAPLVTSGGHVLGALCVMDQVPRQLTVEQIAALRALSRHVVSQIELRRQSRDLAREAGERLRAEERLREQFDQLRCNQAETARLLELGQRSRRALLSVLEDEKRSANVLRESENRFRQLAENIQEVFWVTDISKQAMLYVSPAYEIIWGRTCESLYAAPWAWAEAIHEEDRPRILESAVTRQLAGTYQEEYRIVRPDGTVRWIFDRAFPVRDAGGEVYRIVGVAEDITDRKNADHRVHEQASLLDKARDAIIVRDLDHRIAYWNKGAERLYGWTPDEVIGRTVFQLLYVDVTQFEKASEAVIRQGEWMGELRQVNKQGVEILVEARWTLVLDPSGQPYRILTINTDITEKKKLEQQFLRAQRMESIGTLAGGIAHDLNNVLSPIMMSIDLLLLTVRDDRTQRILSTIETSARRGADMVQQILSFARGVEGQRVMIAAAEIIKDMQHLVQDTFPKNILFKADLPDKLPSFLGDHTQLHQVLLNLCVNSRDAMPGGGKLTVRASSLAVDDHYAAMTPDARPGSYLMITVSDTGTGMPQEVVDKIFDPFFTTKELGKGTGLGLSTVLAIVRSHDGFLKVQSTPGEGTTFVVCFPTGQAESGGEPASQVDMHPRGQDQLVLLVDDEAAVRLITQQTLEAFGYRVLVAADGAEAIALYAQHLGEIAAVITDMMMPVMDGPATIQVLKRLNPAVKIIAASGLNADGSTARAAGMGVEHFLPKPHSAHTVLMTLHQVLNAVSYHCR